LITAFRIYNLIPFEALGTASPQSKTPPNSSRACKIKEGEIYSFFDFNTS
jgi:hypothetical protein